MKRRNKIIIIGCAPWAFLKCQRRDGFPPWCPGPRRGGRSSAAGSEQNPSRSCSPPPSGAPGRGCPWPSTWSPCGRRTPSASGGPWRKTPPPTPTGGRSSPKTGSPTGRGTSSAGRSTPRPWRSWRPQTARATTGAPSWRKLWPSAGRPGDTSQRRTLAPTDPCGWSPSRWTTRAAPSVRFPPTATASLS